MKKDYLIPFGVSSLLVITLAWVMPNKKMLLALGALAYVLVPGVAKMAKPGIDHEQLGMWKHGFRDGIMSGLASAQIGSSMAQTNGGRIVVAVVINAIIGLLAQKRYDVPASPTARLMAGKSVPSFQPSNGGTVKGRYYGQTIKVL